MVIRPIIFCTVVTGIAGMGDMKEVGRVERQGRAAPLRNRVDALARGQARGRIMTATPGSGFNHESGHHRDGKARQLCGLGASAEYSRVAGGTLFEGHRHRRFCIKECKANAAGFSAARRSAVRRTHRRASARSSRDDRLFQRIPFRHRAHHHESGRDQTFGSGKFTSARTYRAVVLC